MLQVLSIHSAVSYCIVMKILYYSKCLLGDIIPLNIFISYYPSKTKRIFFIMSNELFYDEDHYHIESSPLICRANQCTGFTVIGTLVMKELNKFQSTRFL